MTLTYAARNQGRALEQSLFRDVPLLEVSPSYNGTAGSGFASTPSDPARTTAKPIVRLLDPPNQYFTDTLIISVMALANNTGTLIGGIERVRFRFEGGSVDVMSPVMRGFRRYDGSRYSLPCYTVKLKKPAGINGIGNVYIEAIPANPVMQSRVLGPYQFGLVATKHDWDKTVGATGSGADYTNASLTIALTNAINAAKAAAAQNPRLTFISGGTYDLAANNTNYTPQGYLTLECAAGVNVTFAKASYTTDAAMLMRTWWNGLWFRGAGFTFDFAFVDRIWHETQTTAGQKFAGRSHVFEGVRFTRSTALGALIRGHVPGGAASFSVTGSAWVMDCQIEKLQELAEIPNLLRGCIYQDGFNDVAKDAACMVANVVNNHTSQIYRALIPALTVQYTGAGTTADLSLSGGNNAATRTFTARVNGVSVGTFNVLSAEAAFTANTNYTVANVVNWINSLPDWTATLQDNTRRAQTITTGSAGFGEFLNVNTKTPLQLYTAMDLHTDFYQKVNGDLSENVLIYGNTGNGIDAQLILIGGTESRDYVILNNALGILQGSDDNPNNNTLQSQLAVTHRHVVVAHNSFPQQALTLRTGAGGGNSYNPDTYCLIANNSFSDIRWSSTPDADVTIKDNHLHASATGTGGTGVVKSGDETTLYLDYEQGDYTPAGALAANTKPPVWGLDVTPRSRGNSANPGALVTPA